MKIFKLYKPNTPNWRQKNSNHYVPILIKAGAIFKSKGIYEIDNWTCYPSKGFAMNKKDTDDRRPIEEILKCCEATKSIETFEDIIRILSKIFKLTPHKTESNYYIFTYKGEEHYIMKHKDKIVVSFFNIYQNKNPQVLYEVIKSVKSCM